MGRIDLLADVFDDALGLLHFVLALHDAGPRAAGRGGLQHLFVPVAVERDERVGVCQDRGGRTVVVFEPHDLGVRPVLLESQDVRDLGPAPAVDRLVVVAHDAQVAMAAGERFDDLVLAVVGVLVFVDEHVIEPLGFGAANGGEASEKLHGEQQQVVEIDGADALEILLIAAVGGGRQVLAVSANGVGRLLGAEGGRLPAADDSQQVAGRERRVGSPAARAGRSGPGFLVRCDRR